jgi:hypothetical protein
VIAALLLLASAQLPEGPGKGETINLCAECHDFQRVSSQRHDSAGWQKVIDEMTTRGLTATDEEIRAVLAYLTKSFGPARKRSPAKPR